MINKKTKKGGKFIKKSQLCNLGVGAIIDRPIYEGIYERTLCHFVTSPLPKGDNNGAENNLAPLLKGAVCEADWGFLKNNINTLL